MTNEERQQAIEWLKNRPITMPGAKKMFALAVEALEAYRRGKWIDKSGGIEGAWNYCSVCGEQAIDLYDFCPNCGADMRGEADGRTD